MVNPRMSQLIRLCWVIALIMDWLLSVTCINQLIGNFVSQFDTCMSDAKLY